MEAQATVEAGVASAASTTHRGRLLVVYLATLAVDVWLLVVLLDVQMDRSFEEAIAASTRVASPYGLALVGLLAFAFIPALVLSMELSARTPPPSIVGRALAGAVAWSSWSAVVALSGSSLSGLVLFDAPVFAGLGLLAASGAVVAGVGLSRHARPASRTLIVLALAIVTLVVIGAVLTAGRWGSPA